MAEPAPVRPIYAWFVVLLLFVLAVVSYTDRYVLTLLIDPIKQQFSISDVEISILLGLSFTLIYGVFGIIMGYAADRLNRRNIIFAGVILWSLATLGCGLAHDFVQLFLARLLVGAGEAVLTPAAVSLISDYFAPSRRGAAVGAYLTGITLGGGIAVIAGGLILGAVGNSVLHPVIDWAGAPWRAVLVILGVPGLVLSPLVFLIREPARRDDRREAEGPSATALSLAAALPILWRAAPLFFAVAGIAMAEAGIIAWAPSILIRDYGLAPDRAGVLIGATFAFSGTTGVLAGGILGDWAKARGGGASRIRVCLLGSVLAIPCAAFGLTGEVSLVLIGLGLYRIFSDWTTSCGISTVLDQMPNRLRGLATSVVFFLNVSLGVGLGPTLVALVNQHEPGGMHGLASAALAVAVPVLLGVIGLFALAARAAQLPAETGSPSGRSAGAE